MIRNTNRILIAAAVLAVALTFGNVVAAHAGSNDGGPFRYTTQSNESEARSNVGTRRAKRAPAHAALTRLAPMRRVVSWSRTIRLSAIFRAGRRADGEALGWIPLTKPMVWEI